MSARFVEMAGSIPADIGDMEHRLSGILNAATVEAEEIRAEAHRYAETVRGDAEERAVELLDEAKIERQQAVNLRVEMENRSKQSRSDINRQLEQASRDAAARVASATSQAEEILAQVKRDTEAQCAAARENLNDLVQVRDRINAQLKHFYDKFYSLEQQLDPPGQIGSVSVLAPPSDSDSPDGAHSDEDDDVTHGELGGVG
ncbi:hypothetical protein [Mycobacterium sp.]|uniref:hypothetical protein n=1 Tax=Mycobacterium sp. TaxID=1785 RepID=UPI003A88438A